jgi:hypothetical protein
MFRMRRRERCGPMFHRAARGAIVSAIVDSPRRRIRPVPGDISTGNASPPGSGTIMKRRRRPNACCHGCSSNVVRVECNVGPGGADEGGLSRIVCGSSTIASTRRMRQEYTTFIYEVQRTESQMFVAFSSLIQYHETEIHYPPPDSPSVTIVPSIVLFHWRRISCVKYSLSPWRS